jgi:methyl-accepting chemotaxis protein
VQPELLARSCHPQSGRHLDPDGRFGYEERTPPALNEYRIVYRATTPLAEHEGDIFSKLERHLDLSDELYSQLYELNLVNRSGTVSLGRARDAAARIATIADERADAQAQVAQAETSRVQTFLLIGFAVQVLGIAVLLLLFGRDIAVSLRGLLQTAQRFEQGDLQVRSQVPGEDEFAELGRTFNSMAGQLGELVGGLEARVAERTRDLVITAEIGEAVVAHRDPRELMREVVDLIRGLTSTTYRSSWSMTRLRTRCWSPAPGPPGARCWPAATCCRLDRSR